MGVKVCKWVDDHPLLCFFSMAHVKPPATWETKVRQTTPLYCQWRTQSNNSRFRLSSQCHLVIYIQNKQFFCETWLFDPSLPPQAIQSRNRAFPKSSWSSFVSIKPAIIIESTGSSKNVGNPKISSWADHHLFSIKIAILQCFRAMVKTWLIWVMVCYGHPSHIANPNIIWVYK